MTKFKHKFPVLRRFWMTCAILCLMLVIAGLSAQAQILHPVKWGYAAKKLNNREAVVLIKATIEDGWHIYSAYQKEGGPVATAFVFTPSPGFSLVGSLVEPKPLTRFEEAFKMDVSYFEHSVVFRQKVLLKGAAGKAVVSGSLKFMCCNDRQCLAPETLSFSIPVN